MDHAERQRLFPARQSSYSKHHSTETTVVSVLNDVISAADYGQVTALVLLDLRSDLILSVTELRHFAAPYSDCVANVISWCASRRLQLI